MKNIIIVIFLLMISTSGIVFAQDSTEVLRKTDDLVKNRQYNSAFKLLNEADPENQNPEIVLKKINILLYNYVRTDAHQDFGLKDFSEGEIIDQLGEESEVYTNYQFGINTILEELIKKYPKNWSLYKALGEYYFEVYSIYDEDWVKPKNEVLALAEQYYSKAEQNNVFDVKSLNALGYIQLQRNNPKKSLSYLQRLLKTDSNNPDTHYYLACAYYQLGKSDKGLEYANTSLNIYASYANKAVEARFLAVFYHNKKDDSNALKYYAIYEKLRPYQYYDNLSDLLELFIKAKDLKSAAMAADALFAINLSPHSLSQIWDLYSNNGFNNELLQFFEAMETKYASQDEVVGGLLLTKAFYYKSLKEWNQAKQCFKKARERFGKYYKQDSERFRFMDGMLESEEFQIEYIQFEEANKTKK